MINCKIKSSKLKTAYNFVKKYKFSPCTFIDFTEFFPPARLFCPACLMFFKNFPTCTLIPHCTSIRYTRVHQGWVVLKTLKTPLRNTKMVPYILNASRQGRTCCKSRITITIIWYCATLQFYNFVHSLHVTIETWHKASL